MTRWRPAGLDDAGTTATGVEWQQSPRWMAGPACRQRISSPATDRLPASFAGRLVDSTLFATTGSHLRMSQFAVFGHPISHSLSPRIHHAFAQQFDIELEYRAIDAVPTQFDAAVRRFFDAGGVGANVTLPHKAAAFALADECSIAASRAGTANVLTRLADGRLASHNTDGDGMLRDLTERHGVDLRGQRALLLGAGGAARGVAWNLLDAGMQTLTIVNRSPEAAATLAAAIGEPARAHARGWDELATIGGHDLIVTPPRPACLAWRCSCRSACSETMRSATTSPTARRQPVSWTGPPRPARAVPSMASACWWKPRPTPSRCGTVGAPTPNRSTGGCGGRPRERHGLPDRLRCLLHRAVDLLADPGHAPGQAGRGALRATHRRQPLRHFRPAGTPGSVCQPARRAGDVRGGSRQRAGLAHATGTGD